MYVQYCQCLELDNFENVRKIVVPNGPFNETVLYCCEECYRNYFAKLGVSAAMLSQEANGRLKRCGSEARHAEGSPCL